MPTLRILAKGFAMIMTLVLLGFIASHFQLDEMFSQHWIDAEVRGKGGAGQILFVGMAALATALSFPRQVVAFLAGYAFGFATGTALSTLAGLLGCMLGFYYARWLGRGFVQKRFPGRIRKLDAFLHQHPFSMTLVIRLLPVGHNASTNLLAGVSSVRAMPFFAGSGLGYLPQNLVFALAGSGVNLAPELRLSLATLLFILSALLGIWLYRRHRQQLAGVTEADERVSTD